MTDFYQYEGQESRYVVECPICYWINIANAKNCRYCGSEVGWFMRSISLCPFDVLVNQLKWYHAFKDEPEADADNFLKIWKMELFL